MLEGEAAKRLSAFADPHRSFTQRSGAAAGAPESALPRQVRKPRRTRAGELPHPKADFGRLSVEQHLHELWRLTPWHLPHSKSRDVGVF